MRSLPARIVTVFAVLFVFASRVSGDDNAESVLSAMLEKHPFDFHSCDADRSDAAECTAPAGLEKLEVTSGVNIQVILDASGSMAGTIGGKTKYQIAIQALDQFVNSLPAHINLAIRVYGHKGSNQDSGKALSCESSSVIHTFQPLNKEDASSSVRAFEPTGWTPLALSLERSLLDFNRYDPDTNSNLIYLLTDGIETCGGDPVAAAAEIASSNVKVAVNVVGFDIDNKDTKALASIAEAGNGEYFDADSLEELVTVFTDQIAFREWRQYIDCRWTSANRHIRTIQNIEQDRFNCVLDMADENIARIENDLNNMPDMEPGDASSVMLKLYEHKQTVTEPHYQRYVSGKAYDDYQKELSAIEALRHKLDELE